MNKETFFQTVYISLSYLAFLHSTHLQLCLIVINEKLYLTVYPLPSPLKCKFPEDREAGETDTSYQPYLIASFLQGATFENGYQPDYPYVLKFYENPSPFVKQGESSYLGKLYHWCIMRYGEKEVDATIAFLDDDEPYLVTECSDFTAGVPAVKFWEDTLQ